MHSMVTRDKNVLGFLWFDEAATLLVRNKLINYPHKLCLNLAYIGENDKLRNLG